MKGKVYGLLHATIQEHTPCTDCEERASFSFPIRSVIEKGIIVFKIVRRRSCYFF